MAKNITLLGASYSNVPAVQLPQTGGGTARFDDASVTTATASDVASGKIFLASDGTITTGTASGGGGADLPIFDIVYDMNWNRTITCNETFAQCWARWNSADVGSYVRNYFEDGQYYDYNVATAVDGQVNDYLTYVISGNSGAIMDIVYHANGTISITEPSAYTTELNVTQNGYYYPSVGTYSAVSVNVPSSASNFVTGTFTTGSSTSTNETVDVPYYGSGYPLMLVIYVEGGCYNSAISGWYNSMTRYAVGQFCITKSVTTSTPTYATSGGANYGTVQLLFKNSTSSATSYSSTRSASANSYSSSNATGTSTTCVRWRSNTKISYRTAGGTSSTYGLLEDTTYRYVVYYSE